MLRLYEFTVLRFYRVWLLTLHYIDTWRLYDPLRIYRFTALRRSSGHSKFDKSVNW